MSKNLWTCDALVILPPVHPPLGPGICFIIVHHEIIDGGPIAFVGRSYVPRLVPDTSRIWAA